MKSIALLITLFLLIHVGSFAQVAVGALEFFSENGETFNVFVNGEKQFTSPHVSATLPNLKPGLAKLLIVFTEDSIDKIDQAITVKAGIKQRYVLRMKNLGDANRSQKSSSYQLRLVSETPIGAYQMERRSEANELPTHIPYHPCDSAVDSATYEQTRYSASLFQYEEKRMMALKNVLKGNCFTATQIAGLTALFEFENNKLEFAKAAYYRCTDTQNFSVVKNVFQFDMNKEAIDRLMHK